MRIISRPFEPAAGFFALPALLLIAVSAASPNAYGRGLNNADKPFFLLAAFLAAAGLVLWLGTLIWVLATWSRSSRITRIYGMVCIFLPLVVGLALLPVNPYQRGLERWAARNVNAKVAAAIRDWHAAQLAAAVTATAPQGITPGSGAAALPYGHIEPLPDGADEYDPTTFPTELVLLAPQRVYRLPDQGGVFLRWGDGYSLQETRRRLYVGPHSASGPPSATGWTRTGPGVWLRIGNDQ